MNKKVLIALISTVLVILIVGVAMYFFAQDRKTSNVDNLNGSPMSSSQPVIIFEEESSFNEGDASNAKPSQTSKPSKVGVESVVAISLPASEGSKPTAFDLTFYYDPDVVEVVDIKPGGIWSGSNVLRKNIDNDNGRVRLAAGQGFEAKMTDSRQVATISYKPLQSGEITFTLASNSTFAYVGRNIPEQVSSGQLVIQVQGR